MVGRKTYINRNFNCGFDTMSSQIINIRIKFYMMVILFILFDVELLFVYRLIYLRNCDITYKIVYILVIILIIRYLYELNEGLLCWI